MTFIQVRDRSGEWVKRYPASSEEAQWLRVLMKALDERDMSPGNGVCEVPLVSCAGNLMDMLPIFETFPKEYSDCDNFVFFEIVDLPENPK